MTRLNARNSRAAKEVYFGVWSSEEAAHSSACGEAFTSSARFNSASRNSESTTTTGVKTAMVPRASSVHMLAPGLYRPGDKLERLRLSSQNQRSTDGHT